MMLDMIFTVHGLPFAIDSLENQFRLGKPIIHTHFFEHSFSFFQVLQGLIFPACVRVKFTQVEIPGSVKKS